MALMDIDFVNQYRAVAMSQFSGQSGFDDAESQDEEISVDPSSFYTRPSAMPGKLADELPTEMLMSNYPSTKDQSLGKSNLSNTAPRQVSYSIN